VLSPSQSLLPIGNSEQNPYKDACQNAIPKISLETKIVSH
jgi:hypothetical protein